MTTEPRATAADGRVRIRRFEAGDGPGVRRVNERALRAVEGFQYVEGGQPDLRDVPGVYLDGRGEFLVAEWVGVEGESLTGPGERVEPGAIVGCGGLRWWSETTAEVRRMRVSPALQGAGVGRATLETLESVARSRGAERCTLSTMRPLERARAFYERAGYAEIGREAFAWGEMRYFRKSL